MALYDLVSLRQALINSVQVTPSVDELTKLRDAVSNVRFCVNELPAEHQEYIDQLTSYYTQIIELTKKPASDLTARLTLINEQINKITHQLFSGNYSLENTISDINFIRTNRLIKPREDVEQDVKQRIMLHTNWRYPSLEIGCRDGEWTQFMVAADPLYIADQYPEFLTSTAESFTPTYQRRLRQYTIVNHNLSALPAGQMGFVFSWGYFNYVSMDTMRQYLTQVFKLLKPGGVFMFSYNDGDTPTGAGMAESFAQSYMPKSMLVPLCGSLGYDVVFESNTGTNITWIEIKKPGELKTVKAHQVLGEIIPIQL